LLCYCQFASFFEATASEKWGLASRIKWLAVKSSHFKWKKGETTARNEKRFVMEMQQGLIKHSEDGLNNILNVLDVKNIDVSLYDNTKFINVTMK
jgi:hypothetical protein